MPDPDQIREALAVAETQLAIREHWGRCTDCLEVFPDGSGQSGDCDTYSRLFAEGEMALDDYERTVRLVV